MGVRFWSVFLRVSFILRLRKNQKSQKQIFRTLGSEKWKERKNIFGLLEAKCGKYQKDKNRHKQHFGTFCIFHISLPRIPCFLDLVVFLIFSTFHLHKSKNVGVFCFFYCFVFSIFPLPDPDFLYFPNLLCRFSGSKDPEHFAFACILLLNLSHFPKNSELEFPKCKRYEFVNFVFENFPVAFSIYIHTHSLSMKAVQGALHNLSSKRLGSC